MARHLAVPILSNLTIQQCEDIKVTVILYCIVPPHIVRGSPGSVSLLLRVLDIRQAERRGGGEVGDGADVMGAGHGGVMSPHVTTRSCDGSLSLSLSVSGARSRCWSVDRKSPPTTYQLSVR